MQDTVCPIKGIMNSWILWSKWQIMDNVADINMTRSFKYLQDQKIDNAKINFIVRE